MIELIPVFAALFGQVAGQLLRKAAEKHVETFFGERLKELASLGKKDELTRLTERSLGFAAELVLDNVKSRGYDVEDLEDFRDPLERFIQDPAVAEELLKPVVDSADSTAPRPEVLREAWRRLEGQQMPEGFQWSAVASAYRKKVERQKVATPELRDRLGVETLRKIHEALSCLAGPQPQADETHYAIRMRAKYQVLDLSALALPTTDSSEALRLRQVFTPQDVRQNPPPVELPLDLRERLALGDRSLRREGLEQLEEALSEEKLKLARQAFSEAPRRPVLEVVSEAGNRRLVLVGDPGSGKSTLTRFLLLSLLDRPLDRQVEAEDEGPPAWLQPLVGKLPLLLELKDFIARRAAGTCRTFLDYWHYLGETEGYHLERSWLHDRLQAGEALVLFDGLDEIFDPAERQRVSQEIAGFAHTYQGCRVLVTTRPVGYQDQPLRNAGFRHYGLQDLDDEQVETFVRGWFGRLFPDDPKNADLRIERVLKACKESRSIRLLAGNPMLLTIMVLIARHQEIPRERWRFYRHSAEVLCHHWDANRQLTDAGFPEYFGLEDKEELLRRIAFRLQGGKGGLAGNFIHEKDLRQEIEDYLLERFAVEKKEAITAARTLVDHLRARNYILCLYGPGVYGFVHRTFLEYFCAQELARRLKEEPEYGIEDLEKVFEEHWEDPAWAEVLRLVCGLVGEKHAGRLIGCLTTVDPEWWKRGQTARSPLVLATQCLGELRNLRATEEEALALLQAIVQGLEEERQDINARLPLLRFRTQIMQAVRGVGSRWPSREWLVAELKNSFPSSSGWLAQGLARLAANLLNDHDEVREFFRHYLGAREPEVRQAALGVLADGWPQVPETRLFVQRATADESEAVRANALKVLAQNWSDKPDTVTVLRGRAVQDECPRVRSTALRALAKILPPKATTALLMERAVRDNSPHVRSTALETLAEMAPGESTTTDFLRERACQDEEALVQVAALAALPTAGGDEFDGLRGQILFSRDSKTSTVFLDPRQSLPEDQIARVAELLGESIPEIHKYLDRLTEFLGWDPRVGAKPDEV